LSEAIRVLIVEDNRDLSAVVGDYLEAEGNVLDFAFDGKSALRLALIETYDVIVLDIMMPGMDGLEFCRQYRELASNPARIIMVTARDALEDILEGFRRGADDYLVKPFFLAELLARIRALFRRDRTIGQPVLRVGDLTFNRQTLEVRRQDQDINLNPSCLKLLARLMEASPCVVPRHELEHVLWGDSPPDSDVLKAQLYKLRNAIDKPFNRPLIHTLQRIGYRMSEA
jgi:DNA-binding response OmpR family regulator